MPEITVITLLQAIVGLGLLNVWILRANRTTNYRGGSSQTLKEEFQEYGLPPWFFLLVGALKIASGTALIIGIWVPALVVPASTVVIALMAGALAMHMKVQDPRTKSIPAFLMLAMSASVVGAMVS
tara:strand:+ start:2335 stop:2712 length:378 start_codon:yes stop_codon:yes gene_type:complete